MRLDPNRVLGVALFLGSVGVAGSMLIQGPARPGSHTLVGAAIFDWITGVIGTVTAAILLVLLGAVAMWALFALPDRHR
jgi:hypothetical protein